MGSRPIIFGEVLFDRFPDASAVLGGAPFNTAWHLQAFGLEPLFVSRVGDDDLGAHIRTAMHDWGMDTSGLQVDPAHPTGTVEVSFEGGEPRYDIVTERAYDHIDAATLPACGGAALLYHGSLALRNPPTRAALAALRETTRLPVFLDVNLRAPWWEAGAVRANLGHARWAKLNDEELRLLAPEAGSLEARLTRLQEEMNLDLLVVTRGGAGAVARTAEGQIETVAPATTTAVVDTVGAGDAFASVLMLGLIKAWPIRVILRRAQDFASAVVGLRGATIARPTFYEQLQRRWESE